MVTSVGWARSGGSGAQSSSERSARRPSRFMLVSKNHDIAGFQCHGGVGWKREHSSSNRRIVGTTATTAFQKHGRSIKRSGESPCLRSSGLLISIQITVSHFQAADYRLTANRRPCRAVVGRGGASEGG